MTAIVRAFVHRARPDAVIVALPQRATRCAIRRLASEQPGITVIATDSYVARDDYPLTPTERAHLHSLVFWQPGTDSLTQQFVARTRALLGHNPEPAEALMIDFRSPRTSLLHLKSAADTEVAR